MSGQLSFDDHLSSQPEPATGETVLGDRIAATPPTPPLQVDVIRSAKRKKTSQARLRGDVLEVRIPAWISAEQERETVEHFVDKFERTRSAQLVDLGQRARTLATELDLPLPASITWVSNQRDRWGSCTPAHGTVRLSDRMANFPQWVIDYVIVHELAHLIEANHSERFWAIVERYPLTERARGYLIAKGADGC